MLSFFLFQKCILYLKCIYYAISAFINLFAFIHKFSFISGPFPASSLCIIVCLLMPAKKCSFRWFDLVCPFSSGWRLDRLTWLHCKLVWWFYMRFAGSTGFDDLVCLSVCSSACLQFGMKTKCTKSKNWLINLITFSSLSLAPCSFYNLRIY